MMGRWSGFEKLQRFLRFSTVQGQPTPWAAGMKENVQLCWRGRLLVVACLFCFFSRELSLWRGCRKRVLTSRFTFPSRKSLAPCLWTLPRLPPDSSSLRYHRASSLMEWRLSHAVHHHRRACQPRGRRTRDLGPLPATLLILTLIRRHHPDQPGMSGRLQFVGSPPLTFHLFTLKIWLCFFFFF